MDNIFYIILVVVLIICLLYSCSASALGLYDFRAKL